MAPEGARFGAALLNSVQDRPICAACDRRTRRRCVKTTALRMSCSTHSRQRQGETMNESPYSFGRNGTVTSVETRNRVLRNTYWLLALSMVPTVLGAWV